ncbi:MAG: cytochrome c3 family protein [Planctomycetota bacterium]|jgi:hypothetical protein
MTTRTGIVLLCVFAVLGLTVVVQSADMPLPGNQIGYQPEQPILFSHQLHAGELGIQCLYCHAGAERSRTAGIPTAALCMGCHRRVTAGWPETLEALQQEAARAKEEERDPEPVVVWSDEIRKLYDALGLDDEGNPIESAEVRPLAWVRVHNLPDYVVFDHRAHVNAGETCETCHGPVAGVQRIRQAATLSMGWCLDCHRQSRARGTLPNGRPSEASEDCSTCHH